jgi:hypothetical protein
MREHRRGRASQGFRQFGLLRSIALPLCKLPHALTTLPDVRAIRARFFPARRWPINNPQALASRQRRQGGAPPRAGDGVQPREQRQHRRQSGQNSVLQRSRPAVRRIDGQLAAVCITFFARNHGSGLDLKNRIPLCAFTAENRIESCTISLDGRMVVVGESAGRIDFLRLVLPDDLAEVKKSHRKKLHLEK